MEWHFLIPLGFFICAGLAAAVGHSRNATGAGFYCGLVFGPLGLIAMLGIDDRPKCPKCFTRLNGPVKICPGCHSRLRWVSKHKPEVVEN